VAPASTGDARELVALQPAGAMGSDNLQDNLLDGGRQQFEQMRSRVACISIAIAVYVVFDAFVNWVMGLAMLTEMTAKAREAQHMRGESPNFAVLAMTTLPNLSLGIALGLLVPLCGYIGARSKQPCLLGMFTCCNFFSCCGGACGLMLLLCCAGLLTEGLKPMAEYMAHCDPQQCLELGSEAQQVDCLASGIWDESYTRHFPEDLAYPADCPKSWLQCPGGPDAERAPDAQAAQLRGWPASPDRRLGVVPRGGRQPLSTPVHRLPPAPEKLLKLVPPPQPDDPLQVCEVRAKFVEEFHTESKMIPVVMPKLQLLVIVKALLAIPAVVLGCFGFCWGKGLYGQVQGRPYVVTPGLLQPALSGVVAARPTDATMSEPLMLSPPMLRSG